MSQAYPLDLVRPASALSFPDHAVAGIARSLRAARIGLSRLAGQGATFAKFAFSHLIGLVFVLVLPFAGIAALGWFGTKALLDAAA